MSRLISTILELLTPILNSYDAQQLVCLNNVLGPVGLSWLEIGSFVIAIGESNSNHVLRSGGRRSVEGGVNSMLELGRIGSRSTGTRFACSSKLTMIVFVWPLFTVFILAVSSVWFLVTGFFFQLVHRCTYTHRRKSNTSERFMFSPDDDEHLGSNHLWFVTNTSVTMLWYNKPLQRPTS